MEQLTDILEQATARIEEGYFYLPIDGGPSVYRERVYCYELYHQMRLAWPPGIRFVINGEIDKSAHPILRELGADTAKPDFLIHRPGAMQDNYAIVEVKSVKAVANGIRKDLKTLSRFRSVVGYQRAIYLIFGYGALDVAETVEAHYRALPEMAPIELWAHGDVGRPARKLMELSSTQTKM